MPDDPASPTCFAHEADDAYMGFATVAEIAQFKTELEAAPAGARAEMLREFLPKIRDEAVHAEFTARLAEIIAAESKT